MSGKLFLVLLALGIVQVAMGFGVAHTIAKREASFDTVFKSVFKRETGVGLMHQLAKRSIEKRTQNSELNREDFIEYLKELTPVDIEKMSEEEKINLLFLIYFHEVQPHELEKRQIGLASHFLQKREGISDDLLFKK